MTEKEMISTSFFYNMLAFLMKKFIYSELALLFSSQSENPQIVIEIDQLVLV